MYSSSLQERAYTMIKILVQLSHRPVLIMEEMIGKFDANCKYTPEISTAPPDY